MTIDFIDRAFLHRLTKPIVAMSTAAVVAPPDSVSGEAESLPSLPEDPILARLLATCPEQWAHLAERVEAAFEAGNRVVAVAARSRGDGCSMTVRGLARVLQARGVRVTCRVRVTGSTSDFRHTDASGEHVLVDAGVWFPPGPLHRGRLARAVIGCHAAVLVRRAERQPCTAHEAALMALGIRVLGEVVTFADPQHSDTPST